MFDIGETVVCINSAKQAHTIEELDKDMPNWVVKDEKYTIRGFTSNEGIVDAVWLEEIVNKPVIFKLLGGKSQEPAFSTSRFRKLKENEIKQKVNINQLQLT